VERKKLLKVLLVSLAFVLVAIPLLAACAGAPQEKPENEFLVAGCGVGSTNYPMAVGLMTVINETIPGYRATAIASGCTLENIRTIDAGEVLMGTGSSVPTAAAYYGGTEKFPDPMNINFLLVTWGAYLSVMTLDPDIKTFDDIRGKKVALGEPGATTPIITESVLKGAGLVRDVDYQGSMIGESEAAEALIDGRVDVFATSGSSAQIAIVQLTQTKKVYFIPFPLDKMDAIATELKTAGVGRPPFTLPAGTYKGLEEDYPTFATTNCFMVNADAAEDLVYTVVKALWENIEIMEKIHPACKELIIENVKKDPGFPMHPGALRYYKEVGVLTEDPHKGR